MALRIAAPAKINLHLAVGQLAPDGYHPVDTVLQTLAFGDTVTITPGGPGFTCTPDLGLSADENLAWRAARAMAEEFDHPLDVALVVEKRVPAGAGLGGASADAAAVLVGLATLWGAEVGDRRLVDIARSLGADVPFFLEGGASLFTGRGDVLARRLRALDAPIVLVKPETGVPTGAAYAAFDALGIPAPVSPDPLIAALEADDVRAVAGLLYNAMTPASAGLVPDVAEALAHVAGSAGVLGAAMAGSGSAVFGICASTASAEDCAAAARAAGLWAVSTRTQPDGCVVEAS